MRVGPPPYSSSLVVSPWVSSPVVLPTGGSTSRGGIRRGRQLSAIRFRRRSRAAEQLTYPAASFGPVDGRPIGHAAEPWRPAHHERRQRSGGTTIDTTIPHSARIWDYWRGGKDDYARQ